jgi:hypothetical protein
MNVPKRDCIILLGSAVSVFLCVSAAAQEGYYGVGHDKWHQGFYSTLKRNDGGGSCCNLMDCRPTQSRIVGDHYEVKVDGVWTPVPYDKINNVVAPDGGAQSALQDRWVRTRAFYSVSFCHRRADGSMGRVPMPKSANRTSSQEIDAAGSHRQISRGVGEGRKRLEARSRYLERRQVEGPSGMSALTRRRGD